MDVHKLKQILKREEGPKLDFKAGLHLTTESEKKELTKDVIAMANSMGGRGYIVFGVEDKTKRVMGIDPGDFKEEQIQQIIYNRCDPPVPISVEFIEFEGKMLAVLTVYRSDQQPHQMMQNGAFYIRRGSTTDTARRSEIARLFQENGLMTYETVIVKNTRLEDLDQVSIQKYFSLLNVISDRPSQVLMEAMGIIASRGESEEYHATIGGLLLFGENPSIYLPQVYCKVETPNDVRFFYGNILIMLNQTVEYLRSQINDESYPMEAVEEVIANALVHRDYLDNSRGVSIVLSEKNIEISNPGALMAGNSVYKYIRESNPDRRNAWLYQRLLTLDDKKRFMKSGMGMKRIRNSFEEIGDVKFINVGSQNLFKAILPRGTGKVSNVKWP